MSCRVCKACTDGREFDCIKRTIWGFQTGPTWGEVLLAWDNLKNGLQPVVQGLQRVARAVIEVQDDGAAELDDLLTALAACACMAEIAACTAYGLMGLRDKARAVNATPSAMNSCCHNVRS